MEEHTFVTVNGLRVKIKMSYHIIQSCVLFCGYLFDIRGVREAIF